MTGCGRYVFPNSRHSHRELPMSRGTLWSAFRALDIPPDRMTMHVVPGDGAHDSG